MVVEARDQAGQGRLAAAGPADQCDHLPRFDGEADVVQNVLRTAGVAEAQVFNFDAAADAVFFDGSAVAFWRFVQLREDAFCSGQPFLDSAADFRQLADGLGQHACCGDIGHKIAGSRIAAQQ